MIYAQLKTVLLRNTPLTTVLFMFLALTGKFSSKKYQRSDDVASTAGVVQIAC